MLNEIFRKVKKTIDFLLIVILLVSFETLFAQNVFVMGKVVDGYTNEPLNGVSIGVDGVEVSGSTDLSGSFKIEVPAGVVGIIFQKEGYRDLRHFVKTEDFSDGDLGNIQMFKVMDVNDEAPMVDIDEYEALDEEYPVSGLLFGSRDVFSNVAAYNFSVTWFRMRGLLQRDAIMYLNGVPINELENGVAYYGSMGGLNDVLRNKNSRVGLFPGHFSFGGIRSTTSIGAEAISQRKQKRISYAVANRSYSNRIMGVYSTGLLPGKWAFSVSGSRRWAQEGYHEGTFYDAWAYYFSVSKIYKKNIFSFTVLGSPNKKGKTGAATKEMFDLAGTNYYNPYWGYQAGKKRNARVSNRHQPYFILNHHWSGCRNLKVSTAISYQFGRNGSTSLDWFKARDPRPDYYRKLPSYAEDADISALLAEKFRTDVNTRQVNWGYLYDINRNSFEIIENADGSGKEYFGKMSQYIIAEKRYDSQEANINSVFHYKISNHLLLDGGLSYQYYKGSSFMVVDDLLGGDFYLDVDKFAVRDFPDNPDIIQNDLDKPNRILFEGDKFGYDYNSNIRKKEGWLQANVSLKKIDFFLSGKVSGTQFWRYGNVRNGKFPDNSKGASEKKSFSNYGVKGGVTYKINGRHYLYANGLKMNRPPVFRNAFLSPRTRNEYAAGLKNEDIYSVEGGYILNAPKIKLRATAFLAEIKDRTATRSLYEDDKRSFVNFSITGINSKHTGTEFAFAVNPFLGVVVAGAVSVGQYYYTSRQLVTITRDNDGKTLVKDLLIYSKNFYVSRTPQEVYNLSIGYQGKRHWRTTISFNYFNNYWIPYNPLRRTDVAVSKFDKDNNGVYTDFVEKDSELWKGILYQEKVPAAYTVDFFGSKSFKFGDDYFVYLNVGISNILNNTELISGGYEQLRFDFSKRNVNKFPTKYYYAKGLNYFISLAFKMQ